MQFAPKYKLGWFGQSPELSEAALYIFLDALVRLDRLIMSKVKVPPLYKSGVYYQEEPPGQENWQSALDLLKKGFGDCEDLAAYRVAELRRRGIAARPYVKKPRLVGGGRVLMYHIQVWRPGPPGGRPWIEDPSRILGMGWEQEYARSRSRRRNARRVHSSVA